MKIKTKEIYAIQRNICEKHEQTTKCLESVMKTTQGLREFKHDCEEDINDIKNIIKKTKINEEHELQLVELKQKNELIEQSIMRLENSITTEITQCEKKFLKENAIQENLKLKENMKILQGNIVKIQERTIKLTNEITIAENNPFIILLRAQNTIVDEKLLMLQNHLKEIQKEIYLEKEKRRKSRKRKKKRKKRKKKKKKKKRRKNIRTIPIIKKTEKIEKIELDDHHIKLTILENKIEEQNKIITESIESVCLCKFDYVTLDKKLDEIIISNKKSMAKNILENQESFKKTELTIEGVKTEFKLNFEKLAESYGKANNNIRKLGNNVTIIYDQFKILKNNQNDIYKRLNNNNDTTKQNKNNITEDLKLQITNICDDPA